jgi:hypothetical protein
MVEITALSVTMHPIGRSAVFPPEMITMDASRPGLTAYSAWSNAEGIYLPVTELPDAGIGSSAAGTIGRLGRFSVSHYPSLTESEGNWACWAYGAPGRHDGIDWDCLFGPAAHRPGDEIGSDLPPDRVGSAP